jgi:hypothetical protein
MSTTNVPLWAPATVMIGQIIYSVVLLYVGWHYGVAAGVLVLVACTAAWFAGRANYIWRGR